MAKEHKEKSTPVVTPKVSHNSEHTFPRLSLLVGLIFIAVGVLDYIQKYVVPKEYIDITLIVAGAWILLGAIQLGFYNRRHAILKRYI